ncbi:MAG: hypothetical protein GW836_05630 [Paraglaciecola sp.]|nr:hypothetical protein [Paraglaciecola sp.]
MSIKFGNDLLEVGQISRQAIKPVNDHYINQPAFDVGEQRLKTCRRR